MASFRQEYPPLSLVNWDSGVERLTQRSLRRRQSKPKIKILFEATNVESINQVIYNTTQGQGVVFAALGDVRIPPDCTLIVAIKKNS